jgi:hypothetical protein
MPLGSPAEFGHEWIPRNRVETTYNITQTLDHFAKFGTEGNDAKR